MKRLLPKIPNLRFTIFHRVILISIVFVAILLIVQGLVLNGISQMLENIDGNTAYLDTQTKAVTEQNNLVNDQDRLVTLQTTTLEAYAYYSAYLYWRFDAVITTDDRSLEQANTAEEGLREKLSDIASQDEDLAEAADVVVIYLDDFNATMNEAVKRSKADAPKNMISAKVGEAQSHSIAMNSMFDIILEQAAKSVKEASKGVREAGVKVRDAANQVLAASDEVKQKGAKLESHVWIILAVSVVISLALGYILARSITTPIRRLTATIIDIEHHSDLSRRVKYRGKNEIGDISAAFNKMLEKFHQIIQQLGLSSEQLSHASEKSAKVSETTSTSALNLRQETDMVATATNEMAVTVKGINNNTEDAVQQAAEAQEACRQGQGIVSKTMNAIEQLSTQVSNSSTSVQLLAHEAESIGSVLDVIRGIADQTNLLALNAAIEAARAGEQGRGFAVVADEVRTLASKTGDSTNEIQNMIEKLQSGATSAARDMELSSASAADTLEQASKTTISIDGILSAVTAINETNQQIAHATEEQATAAESIDQSIVRISQLTNDVTGAAEHTSEASEQLSKMVDELHNLVAQFKH